MQPYCQKLECVLDWFHIAQKFQTVRNLLEETFEQSLEGAKWKLWHGQVDDALTRIALLETNITDEEKKPKLQGL